MIFFVVEAQKKCKFKPKKCIRLKTGGGFCNIFINHTGHYHSWPSVYSSFLQSVESSFPDSCKELVGDSGGGKKLFLVHAVCKKGMADPSDTAQSTQQAKCVINLINWQENIALRVFFFPALCSETWRSPQAPGFLPMPCTVGKFSKHAQFQAVCIWVPHHVPGIPAPFPCWVPSPLPFPLVSSQVPSPVLSSQPVEHWPIHPLPTSTFSTQHVKSSSSSHRLLPPSCYHTQTHSKITRLF